MSPLIFADVANHLKDFRAGLPMSLLRKHMSFCTIGKPPRGCGVCALARRGCRWMNMTKVDKDTFPYSWLEASAPGPSPAWGMGCRICRLCYNPNGENEHGGTWAQLDVDNTMFQISSILRHKGSVRHQRAQAAFILVAAGSESSSVVQVAIAAPPLDRFVMTLRQLRESYVKLKRKSFFLQ